MIILHYKADLEFYYQTAAEVGEAGMKVEANLTVPEDKDADYVSWYKVHNEGLLMGLNTGINYQMDNIW